MRLLSPALLALLCVAPAGATLRDALLAHGLLNDLAETHVLRIDQQPGPTGARPPLYAVMFSFEDVHWLYAAESGTRVLGPAPTIWPDAAQVTRQLKQIDPGVARVTAYPRPLPGVPGGEQLELPNACVIASLSALANLLGENREVSDAGLVLLGYRPPPATPAQSWLVDHCVLVYRENSRWFCLDPRAPKAAFPLEHIRVGASLDQGLMQLTLRERYPLKSARLLPLSARTLGQITSSALWRSLRATHPELP